MNHFSPHLPLAHRIWQELLKPGDWAIDATAGNGKDTLKLAEIILNQGDGELVALDIQDCAIVNTHQLLSKYFNSQQLERVHLFRQSHATFPDLKQAPKLIVYNLGYLPGGNKSLTTQTATTLESVKAALSLATEAISITCYPGHPEGALEEETLLAFTKGLNPTEWNTTFYEWKNRSKSPSLLLLKRISK